jgi:Asp-tRNA(Asn)/Glu-tRNA(Gln) amidotransferase A subunit family amidase
MPRFEVFKALADDGVWKMVAVPSRSYHTPSAEKPLAGMRVSVKDNFKLAGIKTTMTNRAYLELYAAEVKNAAFVERLLSLGAVIIGKTRMTSFASGEEPTDQWIDFHCPFNPRGDLYQSPGGSSTGAGASLAGYQWLDLSVGTDSELAVSGH